MCMSIEYLFPCAPFGEDGAIRWNYGDAKISVWYPMSGPGAEHEGMVNSHNIPIEDAEALARALPAILAARKALDT